MMHPALAVAPGHRLHGEVLMAGGPILHLTAYPDRTTRPLEVRPVITPLGTFVIATDTEDHEVIADALIALTDEDRRRIRIA